MDAADRSAARVTSAESCKQQRERLHRAVQRRLAATISKEEIEAHFHHMPARYWENVSEEDVVWAIQTVHRFLARLATHPDDGAVVMDTRQVPQPGWTQVLVCTWDRRGLLAKVAGYLSALRLNVLRAEVYTRSDNIVLDVFYICEEGPQRPASEALLHRLNFLLEGGLAEPPRFASAWACQSHKLHPRQRRFEPHVSFNNEDSARATIVSILAGERLGLLHDVLEVFTQNDLNVCEAVIDTEGEVARDIFIVTNAAGEPVRDAKVLKKIEADLQQVL
jgi:[protein-PII] uridylyltransferase